MLEEGAQIVADPRQAAPMTLLGHVTSSYCSAALGRSIALAMVEDGRARIGRDAVSCRCRAARSPVRVSAPVFYDPEGARLDG